MLGAVLGVGLVLAMVMFAANLALGLWRRSSVDAVAWDTARWAATAPPGSNVQDARVEAVARARRLLGSSADVVELTFEDDPGGPAVVLHVRDRGAPELPLIHRALVEGVDHRIVVRRETA